jgi:microsomal dipeptidase-like Zn-dependent dipeptidase
MRGLIGMLEREKKTYTPLEVAILKCNLTYKQVSEKLVEIGVAESEHNIRNKLARGNFSAVFLVQCLEAIGCRSLQLSDG